MARPRRRDDVLRTATTRFYEHGIAATGVDRLAADAGVAKMTLYNNFASKDDLVVAYLEHRDREFFERLDEHVADHHGNARRRAMAVVDVYEHYVRQDGFRGCAFINAAAELPRDHPGREVVRRHKAAVRDRWTDLIAALGHDEPHRLAHECCLLLEGAFVYAGLGVDDEPLAGVRELIRRRLATTTDR